MDSPHLHSHLNVPLRRLEPKQFYRDSPKIVVQQFGIFSVFGYGEWTFNICSSSNWKDRMEFCFRKVGRVTEALWRMEWAT